MYWMRENYARDARKVRVNQECTECENIKQEIYWMWEKFVKDVLNVRKYCKSCTECGKFI